MAILNFNTLRIADSITLAILSIYALGWYHPQLDTKLITYPTITVIMLFALLGFRLVYLRWNNK